MMYPYMTLSDKTEIVHSQILNEDGQKKIIVHFERPTEEGYSDEEIEFFEKLLHSNAHLLYKYAESVCHKGMADKQRRMYPCK